MDHKPPKIIKSYISQQTTSSGWPRRHSTTTTETATSSTASRVNKTYEPVYDQTYIRSKSTYRSLRENPSQPFNRNDLSKAEGNLFYSFGNSNANIPSTSSCSNERTREAPVLTRPSSIAVATCSYPVANTSKIRHSRNTSVKGFSSSTSATNCRYDLRKPAYVVIFHHLFKNTKKYRRGSDRDLELIKNFFKKYNAKIDAICEDFTVAKVEEMMGKVRRKNLGSHSCLIIVIMSHGGFNDKIETVDGFYRLDNAIVEPTLNNSTLKDKPKLFFVQACKGDAEMECDLTPTASNKFDILKCFSSYEGTRSYRKVKSGSFFIQALFGLIEKHSDKEIREVMRLVRNEFDEKKIPQAPTETSTLRKHFFFGDLKKTR
ncbi:caspase-7 [Aedes albopictus]|uniref:Caspase n=1 Tax=Aedes albopictus TaxID=7160 RepID=A0ABM2A5M7_AEDAL|nr:caspase-7-like [Aedes albopictus]